ncbi:O-antigen ligase family protein [[Phormidium ambiguum] IAM M-71]|uniref:O-antigen ligase family protein n=1 Tax=[Phormidium ambiguum] IAM M-71 TaxID=454136 RepID=UPI000AF3BD3B|nr:O-antigen ligase domain-containing protein [Phormidium ambiguum]
MIEKLKRLWESVKITPQNLPEKVIWYYITGTYLLYIIGAQHIVAPAIAWFLAGYLCVQLWQQTQDTPPEERIRIPLGVWIWIAGMLLMEVAIVGAHLDFNMDLPRIVRSTINFFARTWALLALFPLSGCLKIRSQLIYRAACILCIQSLILVVLFYAMSLVNIRLPIITSPLYKIGGVGAEYYNILLYIRDSDTGKTRLYLFTPWAPALGMVGNIYFFLVCQEANKRLRWLGMIGAAAMVWSSDSRLGILCLPTLPVINWILSNMTRPGIQLTAGAFSVFSGMFGIQLLNWYKDFRAQFDGQRASSSRVREVLGRIALYRWQNDAPIWGFGIKEPKGPRVVTGKPIGSHHTWFGVLFTHGIVGFIALAVPMTWSFIECLIKAQKNTTAQVALGILTVLIMFSFAENLETLAYLYWPGLVILGIALKEKFSLVSKSELTLQNSSY